MLTIAIGKAMLKDIVDETSLGKYDFMYLRIGKLTLQRHSCLN